MRKNKINNNARMFYCSLCGKCDHKTKREARNGKIVTICAKCDRK